MDAITRYGFTVTTLAKKAHTEDEIDRYLDEYIAYVESVDDDFITGGGMGPGGLDQYCYLDKAVDRSVVEQIRGGLEGWLKSRPWSQSVVIGPVEVVQ